MTATGIHQVANILHRIGAKSPATGEGKVLKGAEAFLIAGEEVAKLKAVGNLECPSSIFGKDTPAFRGELVRLIRKHHPDVVMTTDPYRRPTGGPQEIKYKPECVLGPSVSAAPC